MKTMDYAGATLVAITFASHLYSQTPTILARGPHEKKLSLGEQEWVEMSTGLNRWDGQNYVECSATLEAFQNGNLGQHTQHQLILANDAADSAGSVDCLWMNGVRWRTRTTGLAYFSRLTGQSVMFAEIRSAQAQTAGAQTLWADCFEGATCDLLVKNDRIGVECDIVVRAQLIAPTELGFAANDDSLMLQVWHEVIEPVQPRKVRHVTVAEANPAKRALYVRADTTDDHLDWGAFYIGKGRAFAIPNAQDAQLAGIAVHKRFDQTPDEKWWLVEEVELSKIAPLLATLPLADARTKKEQKKFWAGKKPLGEKEFWAAIGNSTGGNGENGNAERGMRSAERKGAETRRSLTGANRGNRESGARREPRPTEAFAARVKKLGKKKETVTAALDWDRRPGVVLDYVALNAGSTNSYVFRSDTTYYISGQLNLGGVSNILELGVVIRFAKTNFAHLNVTGSGAKLVSWGTHFNPVIFTSIDDTNVGAALPGSDGVPALGDYPKAIHFDYVSSGVSADLNNVRISYGTYGIQLYYGTNHTFSHSSFISCNVPIYADHNDYNLRNILIYRAGTCLYGDGASAARCENVTFNEIDHLTYQDQSVPTLYFTNCLLVNVTNSASYSGANNGTASGAEVFEQVGGGRHYLSTLSGANPHRNAGTTNINSDLLKELRKLTTYPPGAVLTNPIVLGTVLSPRVARDVDLPDRGAHFPPIDYAVNLSVTNATVTLTGGVVVATFGWNGFWLQDNSTLISDSGSILRPNHIVRFSNVQEMSTNWGFGGVNNNISVTPYNYGNAPPVARFRYTHFDRMADSGSHMYSAAADWTFASLVVRDCEFNSGTASFGGPTNSTIALTNNILHRTLTDLTGLGTLSAMNNLFRGQSIFVMKEDPAPLWTLRDNSFDGTTIDDFIGYETTNGWNAYIASTGRLNPGTHPNDLVLSGLLYHQGPFSRWYQSTNSSLTNSASFTNAAEAGFYHTTLHTNGVIEGTSRLDIGVHFPGATMAGVLTDYDGDTLSDVAEDLDGDSIFDSGTGETDWLNYNSLFGIGPGPGLVVFTPLK